MSRKTFAAALFLSMLAPHTALASSAALLPRSSGSGVDAAAHAEAARVAGEVLRGERFTVFDPAEVSASLPARAAACGPEDRCAIELRSALSVDIVVGLRLWGDGAEVERVGAVIVGARGVGQRALVEVSAHDSLGLAVAEVVRAALTVWRTGQGGFDPPPHADEAPRGGSHLEASPINWAIGTLLVLGSAPLLGYGINTAARDGECATLTDAGCTERVRYGAGAGIFTALGAALLIGGVVVWITQPVQVAVHVGPDRAALSLEGRF